MLSVGLFHFQLSFSAIFVENSSYKIRNSFLTSHFEHERNSKLWYYNFLMSFNAHMQVDLIYPDTDFAQSALQTPLP